MSIIASTPQQINMHPCNSSSAKQLFSFSKAERFSLAKRLQYLIISLLFLFNCYYLIPLQIECNVSK